MRVVYTVFTTLFTVFTYEGVYTVFTVFTYEGVFTVFTVFTYEGVYTVFTVFTHEGVFTVFTHEGIYAFTLMQLTHQFTRRTLANKRLAKNVPAKNMTRRNFRNPYKLAYDLRVHACILYIVHVPSNYSRVL